MKSKKLPKLTKQDETFVKNVVETGNLTKSVQQGYGIQDANYAAVKGQRLIRKDNIQQAIEVRQETLKSALLKQGITPEKIAAKIDVLLEAQKITRTYIKGDLSTEIEEEDHTAIDKGLKHAKDIYGVEDLDKPKGQNTTYNFIFNPETQAEIKTIEAKIKERLINAETNKTPLATD